MLSIPHIIVIFVVALVVFGPEKLPELARNLGKVMAEFRRHTTELRSTFEGHLRDLEREADSRKIGGASPAVGAPAQTAPSLASNGRPRVVMPWFEKIAMVPCVPFSPLVSVSIAYSP